MITFEEAKKLIVSGKIFKPNESCFDINTVDIETETEFHDSSMFENEITNITERTLLHIAIQSKNKDALKILLGAGADIAIPIEKVKQRKQRSVSSGNSFLGSATYSDWEDWEPEKTEITTPQLAKMINDAEILDILNSYLNNPIVPIQLASSSTVDLSIVASSQSTALPISTGSQSTKINISLGVERQVKGISHLSNYSEQFITLYDELTDTAKIGRGCHYSILRAKDNSTKKENAFFDFAIIWDEDHDTRIIEVLEQLYKQKKLHHFIVVGERKGGFTAILNPNKKTLGFYLPEEIHPLSGDLWSTQVLTLDKVGNGYLIQDSQQRCEQYINSIVEKWHLGKEIIPQLKDSSVSNLADDLSKNLKINDAAGKISYQAKTVKMVEKNGARKCSLYGFPNKALTQSKEFLWQKKTTSKFFRIGKPLTEGKQSHIIYTHIKKYLETEVVQRKPLNITGCCRRSLIIALSKISTEYHGMPELVLMLGPTLIKLVPSGENGTQRQKGNFKMEIPGVEYDIAYGEGCIKRLVYFYAPNWDSTSINTELRRNVFLRLIAERLATLKSFEAVNFNKYGNIYIGFDKEFANPYDERIIKNIHFLNGLLFLITTVEVLVRLYRNPDGSLFPYDSQNAVLSDEFPVAIAQSRSLLLLLQGKISFTDFLGQSNLEGYDGLQHRASYGAVTGKSTIDNIAIMLNKLYKINEVNNDLIAKRDTWKEFRQRYLAENREGYFVEGRSRMYFDLNECYGSGKESDDETSDYSSEEELEFVNFKP